MCIMVKTVRQILYKLYFSFIHSFIHLYNSFHFTYSPIPYLRILFAEKQYTYKLIELDIWDDVGITIDDLFR